MSFATTDLCDANEDLIATGVLRVCAPVFRAYGGLSQFKGPAVTLKVFEDNTWVRTILGHRWWWLNALCFSWR
jgi:regulator of ribonuclease activity A